MLVGLMSVLILLTAIPVGLILAWSTKEELFEGRKWFRIIVSIALVISIISFAIKNYILGFTLLYIAIVTFVSLVISHKV